MTMVNIAIVSVNKSLAESCFREIAKWKSEIFNVGNKLHLMDLELPQHQLSGDWGCPDKILNNSFMPNEKVAEQLNRQSLDLVIYVVKFPLDQKHFSRILSGNRVVVSLVDVQDSLQKGDLPLHNFIISMAYAYSLLYYAKEADELSASDEKRFAHNLDRKCLFDMRAGYGDFAGLCIKPSLCNRCKARLMDRQVSKDIVTCAEKEMRKLNTPMYERLLKYVKQHPILSLVWTVLSALSLNLLSDIVCHFIYK